jgi:hypothetical protein
MRGRCDGLVGLAVGRFNDYGIKMALCFGPSVFVFFGSGGGSLMFSIQHFEYGYGIELYSNFGCDCLTKRIPITNLS